MLQQHMAAGLGEHSPHRPDPLSAFLGRITRNLALSRLEKSGAKKRGGGELPLVLEELSECVPSGERTESRFEQRALAELIDRFLSEQSEENRLLFMRRYWYLLPLKSAARECGLTESAAKMRLSLLGTDEAALRPAAQSLLNANSIDDGVTTSVLANSVWLGNGLRYNEETLKLLAEEYYTSSFSREFGSEDYTADLFHTPTGDVTAEFMHSKRYGAFCWGERFQAYELSFSSECGGGVRFILPDEGVEINDLLSDPELYDFLGSNRWNKTTYTQVELSLPKFDVSSDLELSDSLKALGVTDVFSENADFSPLLPDSAALSVVRHAVRVVVDEEGMQAAAFTAEVLNGSAPPPDATVEFTLDRPFIFVVESSCGSTLFMGVVNNPLG